MAEKKDDKKDKKEDAAKAELTPEQAAARKKKLIIFGAAGGLVVALAGGGAAFFLIKGKKAPATPPAAEAHAADGKHSEETKDGAKPAGKDDHAGEKKAEGAGDKKDDHADPKANAKDDHSKKDDHAKKDDKEKKEFKDIGFGQTIALAPFHMNLGNPMENRYVRLEVSIEFAAGGTEIEEELKRRMPQLRDAVVDVTRKKSREFLLAADGIDQLRLELKNRINQYMTKKIENVYITDILIE